jgi:hypothetical protein
MTVCPEPLQGLSPSLPHDPTIERLMPSTARASRTLLRNFVCVSSDWLKGWWLLPLLWINSQWKHPLLCTDNFVTGRPVMRKASTTSKPSSGDGLRCYRSHPLHQVAHRKSPDHFVFSRTSIFGRNPTGVRRSDYEAITARILPWERYLGFWKHPAGSKGRPFSKKQDWCQFFLMYLQLI